MPRTPYINFFPQYLVLKRPPIFFYCNVNLQYAILQTNEREREKERGEKERTEEENIHYFILRAESTNHTESVGNELKSRQKPQNRYRFLELS